eukprot:513943-Pyramimonas_sp.AAC.1
MRHQTASMAFCRVATLTPGDRGCRPLEISSSITAAMSARAIPVCCIHKSTPLGRFTETRAPGAVCCAAAMPLRCSGNAGGTVCTFAKDAGRETCAAPL